MHCGAYINSHKANINSVELLYSLSGVNQQYAVWTALKPKKSQMTANWAWLLGFDVGCGRYAEHIASPGHK